MSERASTPPLIFCDIYFFSCCFLLFFLACVMFATPNHCVYIYVFINVYVAIAVYFPCLKEIIYKTNTNGKETK